jgi:hypothetical protein
MVRALRSARQPASSALTRKLLGWQAEATPGWFPISTDQPISKPCLAKAAYRRALQNLTRKGNSLCRRRRADSLPWLEFARCHDKLAAPTWRVRLVG